jgi:hypothetical protein
MLKLVGKAVVELSTGSSGTDALKLPRVALRARVLLLFQEEFVRDRWCDTSSGSGFRSGYSRNGGTSASARIMNRHVMFIG